MAPPPIDTKYYPQSGPAGNFAWFDNKICDFEVLFNHFKPEMLRANTRDDRHECVGKLRNAIEKVSKEKGIRPSIIMAMVMQESTGNVRVQTTWNADGQPTGGLLQCSGCKGVDHQDVIHQADVDRMIEQGMDHFKQNLNENGGNKYKAFRCYNSGSIAPSGDLSDPKSVGTPKYVEDVANRLHGWIA